MSPDLCFIVFSTRALLERNVYVQRYTITCNDDNIEHIIRCFVVYRKWDNLLRGGGGFR